MRRLDIRVTGIRETLAVIQAQVTDMPGLTDDQRGALIAMTVAFQSMLGGYAEENKTAARDGLRIIEGGKAEASG